MGQYQEALDRMSNEAVEYVRGIPVVKTFGQTVFSFKRFRSAIDDYVQWVIHYTKSLRIPMVLYTVIGNCIFAVLMGYAMICFADAPSHEFILNLLYYVIITPILTLMLNRIMMQSENIMIVEDAIKRVDEILNIHILEERLPLSAPANNGIELQQVSFSYPSSKDKNEALKDISISISPRSHVAFVGPSGGGKTTLASIIARFWDVDRGKVCIGGVDVRNISKETLMNTISFVFQDSKLLKTSILENVRLGHPDASREDVKKALIEAQCEDIIAKLPQGIDTVIGSKGTYLSGGEQQRIAIARAMLHDSSIIILDEATAFADPDNEERVQQAFARLSHGKTMLMIAHRLSTVITADCIFVLQKGRIIEQGTHHQLLAVNGAYAKMWKQYNKTLNYRIK